MKDNKIVDSIRQQIKENINTNSKLIENSAAVLADIIKKITQVLKSGNKILLCGNGGSAGDAQHISAEFVGRFRKERAPLPAISLTTNTSVITCLGNDYGYETVFSRQVEALGKKRDILICISTSGNSTNIIEAIHAAKRKKIFTIGMTGGSGGKMKDLADLVLIVPSRETPRIQESHILIAHILCDMVEQSLFK